MRIIAKKLAIMLTTYVSESQNLKQRNNTCQIKHKQKHQQRHEPK
jgi:hypothetical protein